MKDRHFTSAVEILKKIHYITLATVCTDGSPWNSPVSASYDRELNFVWGSTEGSIHSQNIRRDSRAFVVVYDSTAPEGMGEGVYMTGMVAELDNENEDIKKYCFTPSKVWINDEAKNVDGSYKNDIRIELDLEKLRKFLSS
jgi:hypothetical protein